MRGVRNVPRIRMRALDDELQVVRGGVPDRAGAPRLIFDLNEVQSMQGHRDRSLVAPQPVDRRSTMLRQPCFMPVAVTAPAANHPAIERRPSPHGSLPTTAGCAPRPPGRVSRRG
jgi:hypothetical protein